MTIGQLAKSAGVKIETVRYYERIGLIAKPARSSSGHRNYSNEDMRHLIFVRRARDLGFSIEDIRALLKLAAPDQKPCAEVKSIASAHLNSLQAKLGDLIRLEKILVETIEQCSDDRSPACPILEMLGADPREVLKSGLA